MGQLTRLSSGVTGIDTDGNAAIELIGASLLAHCTHFRIVNTSAVAGFYSTDGGTVWNYLPASMAITDDDLDINNVACQLKRVADGSNVTGVFASAW